MRRSARPWLSRQVFIGSCTNGRIEDMRAVASVVMGKKVAAHLEGRCMVVPGSGLVKEQAEEEGLDRILLAAGMDWRQPGCSMCLAMNPDKVCPHATITSCHTRRCAASRSSQCFSR